MPAYWMTFKAKGPTAPKGWPIADLCSLIDDFASNPEVTEWWRTAAHKAAQEGDRFFLFQQDRSKPRGIFGVGNIVGKTAKRTDRKGGDGVRWRAPIRFEQLVNPTEEFLLPLTAFQDFVSESLLGARASGTRVPAEVEAQLLALLQKAKKEEIHERPPETRPTHDT